MDGHAWDNATGEHRVTLVKGDHRWTFRCARGDEAALLTRVSLLAAGDAVDLDWTDAALIARRLGRRLTAEIQSFVAPPEKKAPRGRRAS